MAMSRSISDFQWDSFSNDGLQNGRVHQVHTHDVPPALNIHEAYAAPSVSGPRFFVSDNVPPPPPRLSPYHPPDPTPQQTIVAFSNAPIDPLQLQHYLSKFGPNKCTLITNSTVYVHFQSSAAANQALASSSFYLNQQPVGLIRKQTQPAPSVLLEKSSPKQILKPQSPSLHLPQTAAYHPNENPPSQGLLSQVWDFLTGW